MIADLREQYGSDYLPALKRYGIEERDVAAQLLAGLIGLTFTDLRFRPAVQISDDELRAYYSQLTGETSFEASQDKIEELLRRQRTYDALDQWLVTARVAARVRFREAVFR
jgi:hypothetical protein